MASIGVFDSGVGGLSVLEELIKVLPNEKFHYFADNANCPYGEKTPEFIIQRACAITEHLIEDGCELIVVACNTATAAAIETLRNRFDIPFVGMEPAVKPAALGTQTGVIGVLATGGTLAASKYRNTKSRYEGEIKIVENIGKGFVELVEKGETECPKAFRIVSESVTPLLEAGSDRIVLGCTHYPFLSGPIRRVIDDFRESRDIRYGIELVNPAPAVARQVLSIMNQNDISPDGDTLTIIPEASGDIRILREILSRIL